MDGLARDRRFDRLFGCVLEVAIVSGLFTFCWHRLPPRLDLAHGGSDSHHRHRSGPEAHRLGYYRQRGQFAALRRVRHGAVR
ncbi:hypothetical protein MPLDJ20_90239 [Mesorhizobium plurifarium]|uniref:Uncharacterized protein n=1 Tax=Mesorhizobium plurifarium TaxID=69974 RepID=A0A090FYU1_MESPL|nr:hypothetical protein MPLDJ20_90239 [Mesorhizobium plurifarium]